MTCCTYWCHNEGIGLHHTLQQHYKKPSSFLTRTQYSCLNKTTVLPHLGCANEPFGRHRELAHRNVYIHSLECIHVRTALSQSCALTARIAQQLIKSWHGQIGAGAANHDQTPGRCALNHQRKSLPAAGASRHRPCPQHAAQPAACPAGRSCAGLPGHKK